MNIVFHFCYGVGAAFPDRAPHLSNAYPAQNVRVAGVLVKAGVTALVTTVQVTVFMDYQTLVNAGYHEHNTLSRSRKPTPIATLQPGVQQTLVNSGRGPLLRGFDKSASGRENAIWASKHAGADGIGQSLTRLHSYGYSTFCYIGVGKLLWF